MLAAAPDAWRFQPHPEVWLLVGSVVVLAVYAVRVIGPKVVPVGEPVVTRRQRGAFFAAVAVLWIASDWPVHDVAEEYLYSAHMVQHLMLALIMPPLLLIATPTWLARLLTDGDGRLARAIRLLTRPILAGLLFNAVAGITHAPQVVDLAVGNGTVHYLTHLTVVTTAILMWTPVCGPIPEWRLPPMGQMIYLFVMSILPTVPAAWLTFAEGAVYSSYDHAERLWNISVADDQQAAGMIMKLLGGVYLWSIIAYVFFSWAGREERADRERGRPSSDDTESLTFADVQAEFDRVGSAPPDPVG